MNLVYILLLAPSLLFGQFGNSTETPISWDSKEAIDIPYSNFVPDKSTIETLMSEKTGPYIVATGIKTNIHFRDFKLTKILPNGDKLYQYKINSEGSLGYRIQFDQLKMDKNARLWIYDQNKTNFAGSYNQGEVDPKGSFISSVIEGPVAIIDLLEPKNSQTSDFSIPYLHHFFRGLKSGNGWRTSQACMINAACSEGSSYTQEQTSTCKIVITGTGKDGKPFTGWCTGTLIGNTKNDGTPYILTANHCSEFSTPSDLVNWEYHVLYQSTSCATPSITNEPTGAIKFKGSTAIAYSGSDNGDKSSDFLMVKLTTPLTAVSYNFSFMGWDRSDGSLSGGVCFHHPDGDIKKVSTSTSSIPITSYGGVVLNSHFKVIWTPTANGHSVTQGGSSGSGLINTSKLLVGTLTGGASDCDPAKQSEPDFFGRINKHWNSYGTASDRRLDIWLDPIGSGSALTTNTKKLSETTAGLAQVKLQNELRLTFSENKLYTDWNQYGYELTIYNLVGQRIAHQVSDSKVTSIDLSAIPKGLYIAEVLKNQSRETKKFNW
jgi:lysyl endopeptidase